MTPTNSGPPLDLNRLLEVLTRNDVDFVVVGGSAAGFLGSQAVTRSAACESVLHVLVLHYPDRINNQ